MNSLGAASVARRLVGVLVCLALVGGCGGTPESVDGQWVFVEFSVDGETKDVVVGENASRQPWIRLDSGSIRGSSGCNSFSGFYLYSEGSLELGSGGTLMWCGDQSGTLMEFEFAFSRLMGESLVVSRDGNRMTWTGPDGVWVLEEDSQPGRM